jgi:uncharacterized protein
MPGRLAYLFSMALLAAAVVGCSTAPSRFYTLHSTAVADGGAPAGYGILVGPVSVPASVDRPELVLQVAPNQVELQEFDRWAGSLGDSIARAVAGDLAALLGTPDVAVAPLANFKAAYRVTIDVQRFDSMPRQSVFLEAVWAVHPTGGGETRSGRSVVREAVQGDGFDALAAAHSRALGQMSGEIAAAIRAMPK